MNKANQTKSTKFIIELCAHVTLAPDDNNKNVFNNGISNSIDCTPNGGHIFNSISGTNAECNSAQNIVKNKKNSVIINNPNPTFIPLTTTDVC
ncbi:hypothetical protein BB560_000012 [Smittium megazygosporum]|uniref:Uncharacterized protein n=1 Tax=Smittium megazygosporum TaxID=133381 RepID=A0A2T9ZLI9_9FUNG|nr:hypothetical protein BB560_000012 [Smittium megazygosporum]